MVTDERRQAIDTLLREWDAGHEEEAKAALLQVAKLLLGTDEPTISLESSTPPNHEDIESALRDSTSLRDLKIGWDGERGRAICESVWQRTANFVRAVRTAAWATSRTQIAVPDLLPSPDGSIDIEWENIAGEFVVRVPPDSDENLVFYGHRRDGDSVRGSLDEKSGNHAWLFHWIAAA